MKTFRAEVDEAFAGLIDSGALRVESDEVGDAFDNAAVVLSGEKLRIQLFRDRSQVFADVAAQSDPTEWLPLQAVLRSAGVELERRTDVTTPREVASLVERYSEQLRMATSAAGIETARSQVKREGRDTLERLLRKQAGLERRRRQERGDR